MTGAGLICKLPELQDIHGADNIKFAKLFGETIIVAKNYHEGQLGILFDIETQLSYEYAKANNLYRHSEYNQDKTVKGFFEDNRRVRPIKLRGVKCSAYWAPISSLDYLEEDLSYLKEGLEVTTIGKHEVCNKYISQKTRNAQNVKQGKKRENLVPHFAEHIDTGQVRRELNKFEEGDVVYCTEKVHGTSLRVANIDILQKHKWWQKLLGIKRQSEYGKVVGSRRVTKYTESYGTKEGQSYYDEDVWTTASHVFDGKLDPGLTVYAEIVGYLPSGELIMPGRENKCLKSLMDKEDYNELINRYGQKTIFNYGCIRPTIPGVYKEGTHYKVIVYRITLTNEKGTVYDLGWDQVKLWCESRNIRHVPELSRMILSKVDAENIEQILDSNLTIHSKNFPTHLSEGCVYRIEKGGSVPVFLKDKTYEFKCLEGIIKESNNQDIEESN